MKWVSLERRRSCSRAADAPPWRTSFSIWIKEQTQTAGHPVLCEPGANLRLGSPGSLITSPAYGGEKSDNKKRHSTNAGEPECEETTEKQNHTQNINSVSIHDDQETRLSSDWPLTPVWATGWPHNTAGPSCSWLRVTWTRALPNSCGFNGSVMHPGRFADLSQLNLHSTKYYLASQV